MNNKAYRKVLNDFVPGEEIQHWPGKTITESDNNLFCLLTMNHHPVHLDREYAESRQHGKILVVGTYVLSLAIGLTVPDISGAAIANLGYEKIDHIHPVYIGDTLYAKTRILDVRQSTGKPDRGIVTVETEAENQGGIKVLYFKRKILVPVELTLVIK